MHLRWDFTEDLEMDAVFQIRHMIEAVVHYTCSKVDIIAWSMGSPVSRKAILGGTCPDTNETLGEPLTDYASHSSIAISLGTDL